MIEGYREYEDFVRHITRSVPLIRTEQLRIMISRYFSQSLDSTDVILFALQRNLVILMSEDGWSMTVGQYMRITGDNFLQGRNAYGAIEDELNRLPEMDNKCREINKPLSECMWIVADMLPDSRDFMIAASPWVVAFTSDPTEERASLLYEITYIPKGYEVTRTELLKNVPKITSNLVRKGLRRICIMEDESYAFRVPHNGFSHIIKIDHSRKNHYRIIETRSGEDRWRDDPYEE
ncbi:MAG: hypothetical protein IKD94_03405 [Erysipelotrichaceae bacterium]|nr:hypothetical protein [Erysipelotrichaceae bacterium]